MSYQKFTQQLSGVQDWAKGLVRGLTNKQKRIGVCIAYILLFILLSIFANHFLLLALSLGGAWWSGTFISTWANKKFPD